LDTLTPPLCKEKGLVGLTLWEIFIVTLLHVIETTGIVTSQNYMGELEFACPPLGYLRALVPLASDIEHVFVWFKDKQCHMFVDEHGRRKRLRRNEKATRVYYNAVFKRERVPLIYNDLSYPVVPLPLLEINGFDIVGTAVLWEGEME
jgi:hypothetical protein